MPDILRSIIVTGASGYIGSRLVRMALEQGRDVTLLTRSPRAVASPGTREVAWSLGEPLPPTAVDPAQVRAGQALIHLAHDWRNRTETGEEGGINIEGTRTLLASARAAGLGRIVFVSSQSAREDAANIYGRVKWRIEQLLAEPGEVAARVGLVYGGKVQAMYGLLNKLTKIAPLLPMVDPWRQVQPIHLDEVCRGLLLLADGAQTGWVGLAGPVPVRFDHVLKALARELHGKPLPVLPVPLRFALFACDMTAKIPVGPTVDRERVLGLAGTRPMDCASHLAALGLEVQPIEVGLRRERGARRLLLAEARTLLSYILGATPSGALQRRYVRALAATGQTGALSLPLPLRAMPTLSRLIEPVGPASPLGQRLALASALAEASPEGEAALAKGGRAGNTARLAVHLAADAVALPVRFALQKLRR